MRSALLVLAASFCAGFSVVSCFVSIDESKIVTSAASGDATPEVDDAIATGPSSVGDVRFFRRTGDAALDALLSGSDASAHASLVDRFARMEVFSPYFDDKTSWYPRALVYWRVHSADKNDSAFVGAHEDWLLHDATGARVFLAYGCTPTVHDCPLYATDIANHDYRKWVIDQLSATVAKGYLGGWLSDVKLVPDVVDASGAVVTPISTATKGPVSVDDWAGFMSLFMVEIRNALPSSEILHDGDWNARLSPSWTELDPDVQKEVDAADWIELQGAFGPDARLVGGTGAGSLDEKLRFVDAVHARGRAVVVDETQPLVGALRTFDLACTFLAGAGNDTIGDGTILPSTWWPGFDVHLGAPLGARTRDENGLFRRVFQHGLVLALEPGAAPRDVTLDAPMLDGDGTTTTIVHLDPATGAVLHAP